MLALTTTPAAITPPIRAFCADVSPRQDCRFIPVSPRLAGKSLDCFVNVAAHVEAFGGGSVYGWAIWEIPRVMIEAEYHAVWRDPDQVLRCVTPRPSNESRILFLPDPRSLYVGKPIDNVRQALVDHPVVREFIDRAERRFRLLEPYPTDSMISFAADEYERHFPNEAAFTETFTRFAIARRGRNDPCVCGSGKRFKNCCGQA